MYDKTKYSSRTISTFEIISAYFVDIYYNHLYNRAKRTRIEQKDITTTEAYLNNIRIYAKALGRPNSFKTTIMGIHTYYKTTTGNTSLSFGDCVNNLVKEFVPEDLFENFKPSQKDAVLRKVFINAVRDFTLNVDKKYIDFIIDNHSDTDNIRMLKDDMIDCLIEQRMKMKREFTYCKNPKSIQKREYIDRQIALDMKKELKKLFDENYRLKHTLKKAGELIKQRRAQLEQFYATITELKKKVQTQNQIIADRDELIDTLQSQIVQDKPVAPKPEPDPEPELISTIVKFSPKKEKNVENSENHLREKREGSFPSNRKLPKKNEVEENLLNEIQNFSTEEKSSEQSNTETSAEKEPSEENKEMKTADAGFHELDFF